MYENYIFMKTKRKIKKKKHRTPRPETVGCQLSQTQYSNRFPYEGDVSNHVFYLKLPHFDPPLIPLDPPLTTFEILQTLFISP